MATLSLRAAARAKMPNADRVSVRALASICLPTIGPSISLREVAGKTRTGFEQAKRSISHVFVLMLENRSFDHMLGFSRIEGVDLDRGEIREIDNIRENPPANEATVTQSIPGLPPISRAVQASPTARYKLSGKLEDPPHEFTDIVKQLTTRNYYEGGVAWPLLHPLESYPAINMLGFVQAYVNGEDRRKELSNEDNLRSADVPMQCFAPEKLPVTNSLSQSFAICDRWFSSLPGPTVPNRLFAYAASSGDNADSPSSISMAVGEADIPNGSLFDRLGKKDIEWDVYCADKRESTACYLDGVNLVKLADLDDFKGDINDDYAKGFIFIEPNYNAVIGHYADGGNSMHPVGDVRDGEKLIKSIYQKLRDSQIWNKSVLIVTFDEHGGFYDHVPPPRAVPPGDGAHGNEHRFDFSILGPRVPTIIISPYIPNGVVDGQVYDHTSVVASVCRLFGMKALTKRDAAANDFWRLFTLESPRQDVPRSFAEPSSERANPLQDLTNRLEEIDARMETGTDYLKGMAPMIIGGQLKELKEKISVQDYAALTKKLSRPLKTTEFHETMAGMQRQLKISAPKERPR